MSKTLEKWVRKLKFDLKERASLVRALKSGRCNTRFLVTCAEDGSLTIWSKRKADLLHVPVRKLARYRKAAAYLALPPRTARMREESDDWVEAMELSE